MYQTLNALIISLRPRQWLKNLVLYIAIIFGGQLLNPQIFLKTTYAFIIFSLLSSFSYLINDIVDRDRDKRHPTKKFRPVAKGEVSAAFAAAAGVVFVALGLFFSWILFETYFFVLALIFVALQLSYSFYFRQVIIMDALVVSAAFILRLYAGAAVVPTPISSWLGLAIIGASLLLAFGKRRSEATLLRSKHSALVTRETLRHYPDSLLDAMISMSASFAVVSYMIFAFQTSPTSKAPILEDLISPTLSALKWMMLTIPLIIYGVARYLYVIYEKEEGESPEKVLLSDKPLLGTAVLWGLSVIAILYWLV